MRQAMFGAAVVMLASLIAILHALEGLAPLKWWILRHYGWAIAGVVGVMFVILTGSLYQVFLLVPLRQTGRKLTHVDRQLSSSDGVFEDLTFPSEES
jgi:hypothetical protein